MAYIGRSPEYGNAVSQQITGTNSAGPYTLSYDTSTSGVVVSLDGVVQRNSVDFNISGTALTFTSTVGTGIIINVVFTGLTLSFPTPSDNSVDSSAIVAGAVDDSHISGLAASKLTGTIADARFPATLPAASGVNLTALNATNLGSGTVPTARLGSGTASSSTFLRGDQTYAAAGGGKVLQVISTVKTDFQTTTSSTPVDITGLSATITPSATSSKILVTVHITHGATGERGSFHLLESSTEIVKGDAHGSTRVRGLVGGQTADSNGSTSTVSMMYLHSPNSTSSLNYKMTFQSRGSAQYIDINRPTAGADDAWAGTGISTITVMEIGA